MKQYANENLAPAQVSISTSNGSYLNSRKVFSQDNKKFVKWMNPRTAHCDLAHKAIYLMIAQCLAFFFKCSLKAAFKKKWCTSNDAHFFPVKLQCSTLIQPNLVQFLFWHGKNEVFLVNSTAALLIIISFVSWFR